MFGKVKKWLGIEGVKLQLKLPEEANISDGKIEGSLILQSLSEQTIKKLSVRIIEKYTRGRKKEKLIDQYKIGEIILDKEIKIKPEESLEIEFTLPFQLSNSEVEDFGNKNILTGGLAKLAKLAYAAKSDFRVEAEAEVSGVALNPIVKKGIQLN